MSKGTRFTLFSLVLGLLLVHGASRLGYQKKIPLGLQTGRFNDLLKNIGSIAGKPESTTLFFGNSIFQLFLDPEMYDRKVRAFGSASESYNLAFAGHMGLGTLAFVERFRSELPANTHFREVIFEISPLSYAKQIHREASFALDVERPGIFLSAKMWPSFFWNEPELALNALFNVILQPFDWCEAMGVKRRLSLTWDFRPLSIPDFVFERPFQEHAFWRLDTRGLSNWNLPESQMAFNRLLSSFREPENWNRMMRTYVRAHAVNSGYRMDDYGVHVFTRSLTAASSFSKKVYGIVMPYEPEFQRLVEQHVDYEGFLRQVAEDSGITIIDLRKEFPVESRDFADAMHLKKEVFDRLLTYLAERLHRPPGILSGAREPAGPSFHSPSAEAH